MSTMSTKAKLLAAALVVCSAVAGFAAGFGYQPNQPVPIEGAFFCCDVEPCVVSVDGDCKSYVQWCETTAIDENGSTICVEW